MFSCWCHTRLHRKHQPTRPTASHALRCALDARGYLGSELRKEEQNFPHTPWPGDVAHVSYSWCTTCRAVPSTICMLGTPESPCGCWPRLKSSRLRSRVMSRLSTTVEFRFDHRVGLRPRNQILVGTNIDCYQKSLRGGELQVNTARSCRHAHTLCCLAFFSTSVSGPHENTSDSLTD